MALKIHHDENSIRFNKITEPVDDALAGTVILYITPDGKLALKDGAAVTEVVNQNWFDAINNGASFPTAPVGTGARSITIGNNTSSSTFTDTIALGTNNVVGANFGIAIGANSDATLVYQATVGNQITAASVTSNLAYSAKLGYGDQTDTTNYNLLHLYDSGKLELYGAEAQYILPNYTTAEITAPLAGVEGGLIYDTTTNTIKYYDGAAWVEVTGGGASAIGDLTDVVITTVANGDILSYNSTSGDWENISAPGGGDMLASTYDPTSVTGDAFAMDNMVEGTTTKILTAVERTNIANGVNHRADATKHRVINDAGTTTTELFSASKIISDLNGKSDSDHTHVIDDLDDVTNTTPADKDIMIYDGVTDNKYENRPLVEADISDLGTEIVTKTEIADLAGDITMNGGNF